MKGITLALAAAGGYLLWTSRAAFGVGTGGDLVPGSGAPPAAPPATPPAAPSAAAAAPAAPAVDPAAAAAAAVKAAYPGAPPPPASDDEKTWRSAATGLPVMVAEASRRNVKFTADQWNWYRWAGGGGTTTVDLFPAGNRSALMTINEYMAARAAAGLPTVLSNLSGLGGLGAASDLHAIAAAAVAARAAREPDCSPFGMFRLPDGSCTAVDPSKWAWQCGPGIGTDASCVGVPEGTYTPAAQVGLLPSIPSPAPPVTRLAREATARYAMWPSCHDRGGALWDESIPGCDIPVLPATGAALPVEESVTPIDVQGGIAPCLILAFVVGAAVLQAGGRR